MTRMISLSVIPEEDEWTATFVEMSQIATDLAKADLLAHVSLTATKLDENVEPEEELYHDEGTMRLVREAIKNGLGERVDTNRPFFVDSIITDIVSELQNAGILFRERR